jgi:hypothetical protein
MMPWRTMPPRPQSLMWPGPGSGNAPGTTEPRRNNKHASPRRRAWSGRRCARSGGMSGAYMTPLSVGNPICNPSTPHSPPRRSRGLPQTSPLAALPSPLLRRLSRLRGAGVLRWGCAPRWGRCKSRGQGVAAAGGARGLRWGHAREGARKVLLNFLSVAGP